MDNPFAANGNDDFDWGGDQVALSWVELNSTSFFVLFKLAGFKTSHSVPQVREIVLCRTIGEEAMAAQLKRLQLR